MVGARRSEGEGEEVEGRARVRGGVYGGRLEERRDVL